VNWQKVVKLAAGLGIIALMVVTAYGCNLAWEINNWIDLCADESKGNYIWDDDARRAFCEPKK
jgi:hypothetical protein